MAQLEATIEHHLEDYKGTDTEIVEQIQKSVYVDELSSGHHSFEAAFHLYQRAKSIFQDAAMNIRKWKRNDNALAELIKAEEELKGDAEYPRSKVQGYAESTLNPTDLSPVKVLGIPWNTSSDTLTMKLDAIVCDVRKGMTKRSLLSAVSSIFDPLGILSPTVLALKLLFRRICTSNIEWNQTLPENVERDWTK